MLFVQFNSHFSSFFLIPLHLPTMPQITRLEQVIHHKIKCFSYVIVSEIHRIYANERLFKNQGSEFYLC